MFVNGNWKRSGIHVFNITNVECLRCVFVFVDVQHNIHIVQYKHTSQTLCVCYRWTPYNTNTHLKHHTYVMLNTVQYKHISQILCVCYCWTPYNINTHLKHYAYVMLNTVQYKHTSQTLYVCYFEYLTIWKATSINTKLENNTDHTAMVLYLCNIESLPV